MKHIAGLAPFVVFTLCVPAVASAHRLDEYLQATRIAVDAGTIDIELSLTPGSDLADAILARIDGDADGRISASEADAYATCVTRDIRLEVDGQTIPVTLAAGAIPDTGDIRAGVGVIRLSGTAAVASPTAGRHHLSYRNAHMPGVSAYLVNTLAPTDPLVRIGVQGRDNLQRTLTVDYEIEGRGRPVLWSFGGLATIIALLFSRGRGRLSRQLERTMPELETDLSFVKKYSGSDCPETVSSVNPQFRQPYVEADR